MNFSQALALDMLRMKEFMPLKNQILPLVNGQWRKGC
jgi:hypothetical protein